jgi:hypothetical protein
MADKAEPQENTGVDKSLVTMFLKMSPEDRLKSNDNAVRAILELRDAYRRENNAKRGS